MEAPAIALALRTLANQVDGGGSASVPIIAVPHIVHNPFAEIPAKYQHGSNMGLAQRYDDPMPEGTVGTVFMAMTGHVLSMPQPQYAPDGKTIPGKGETFVFYVERVRFQITANKDGTVNEEGAQKVTNALGALMQQSSSIRLLDVSNADTWPFAADEWMNQTVYDPIPKELADASIMQWAEAQRVMREAAIAAQIAPPVVPANGPPVTPDPVVVEG